MTSDPLPSPEQIPVDTLRGVGPRLAERLGTLGIRNITDLLFHLPLRYQDRTRITPINRLRPGTEAVVEGQVLTARVEFGKRRSLACTLHDSGGMITLRFFHFSVAQQRNLERADWLRCFGEARSGRAGLEMYHPEYQLLDQPGATPVECSLTPVYPSTEGLHQGTWRSLSGQALERLGSNSLPELVPPGLLGDAPLSAPAPHRPRTS